MSKKQEKEIKRYLKMAQKADKGGVNLRDKMDEKNPFNKPLSISIEFEDDYPREVTEG